VLVAGGAVLLRSFVFVERYQTYTSTETVIPFRLSHPAAWQPVMSSASDIVLGPDPAAVEDLFFLKGTSEAWGGTAGAVRSASPDDAWLYLYSSSVTYDTTDPQSLRASLTPLLPQNTRFESTPRELSVGGAPAVEMEAVISDPANPQTRLRAVVDVVQPTSAAGALLLVFSAPPDHFEDHRATFEKVRDSLELGP
jgi:hypothetical protein